MKKSTECTCPVCNGTGRIPCPEENLKYAENYGWFGFNPDDKTVRCNNCGGQTMSMKPTGKSYLREDGTPCKHEYNVKYVGRCCKKYICKHCGYQYTIDSSD